MIVLRERKQVGVLYHYIKPEALNQVWKLGGLVSTYPYVSLTRNKTPKKASYFGGRTSRLVFDGDRLSDKFKIEPYQDTGQNRGVGEQEERILWPVRKILPCLFALVRVELADWYATYPEYEQDAEQIKNESPVPVNVVPNWF